MLRVPGQKVKMALDVLGHGHDQLRVLAGFHGRKKYFMLRDVDHMIVKHNSIRDRPLAHRIVFVFD